MTCCAQRTRLEQALIFIVIVAMVIIITTLTLLVVLTTEEEEELQNECDSPTCISEALEILSRVNSELDPCNDFYAFACGNAKSDEERDNMDFAELEEEAKLAIEQLYRKPIKHDDHKLVKVQKTMYRACMNESAIQSDAFQTVAKALKAAGGWPVVEGSEWREERFNWTHATYVLRQLGYSGSGFLDVSITTDLKYGDKYIFKVSIPEIPNVYSSLFDSDQPNVFMANVAAAFGADIHDAIFRMTDVYNFMIDLQWRRNANAADERPYRATVAEFQQKHRIFDWLQFINDMLYPAAKISENDYVLFPWETSVDNWLTLLDKQGKRMQADYMMWKVVEERLPYLTDKLQEAKVKPRLRQDMPEEIQTRSEFCIKEIQARFSPSPIDVMYLRQYLPASKKLAVETLLSNAKSELVRTAKLMDWIEDDERDEIEEALNEIALIVGMREDYFDDKIFEGMDFELISNESDNFLLLLSQASRNHRDRFYSMINKNARDTRYIWEGVAFSLMRTSENEIIIPASYLQGAIFNEERPNYLNYGILGVISNMILYDSMREFIGWSSHDEEAFIWKIHCLTRGSQHKVSLPVDAVGTLQNQIIGVKAAYTAYEKLGEEPTLASIGYTHKQLFWISSGFVFCYFHTNFDIYRYNSTVRKGYSSTVSKIMNSNPDIYRDFNCPDNFNSNSKDRCSVF